MALWIDGRAYRYKRREKHVYQREQWSMRDAPCGPIADLTPAWMLGDMLLWRGQFSASR